jgi:hypothetical protein
MGLFSKYPLRFYLNPHQPMRLLSRSVFFPACKSARRFETADGLSSSGSFAAPDQFLTKTLRY